MKIKLSAVSINMEIPSIIIILTVLFVSISLSSSSSLDNNSQLRLDLLTARVDGLQAKVEQLSTKLDEEKILRVHYQDLNSQLQFKIDELATENQKQNDQFDLLKEEFDAKINLLMATQSSKQEKEIRSLNKRKADFITPIISPDKNSINIISEPDTSLRLPPSSCRQLSTIGHYLDGIYLVANSDTNKIETVYCNFGTSISETLFGNVDVKIKSVHFYVQRNTDFSMANTILPFEIELLNVGGAMNLSTGIFTVPVDGIYHFEFSGMKEDTDPDDLRFYLQVNGNTVSASYATGGLPNYLTLNGINVSLRLKTGDQVTLFKGLGTLNDNNSRYTHYTGWLVEEDLILV